MSSKFELAIWSRDTGQRIPCFDRCQLIKTWISNIKDVCCKIAWYWSHWHRWTGGRTDERTYGRSMTSGYKTKISRIDGLPYFLNNGAPRAHGAPLWARHGPKSKINKLGKENLSAMKLTLKASLLNAHLMVWEQKSNRTPNRKKYTSQKK